MSMSLREQLLAAGLVKKKQVDQAETQQRRQQHQQVKGKAAPSDQQKHAAQQAQAAKAARDQELNRQRQEQAQRKERAVQIRQLIDENRLPSLETDDYFNFIDRGKVRRMAVDAQRRGQIVSGALIIVRFEGRYSVVLPAIAERIRERDERVVVSLNTQATEADANDPYKDYAVPDDLMW